MNDPPASAEPVPAPASPPPPPRPVPPHFCNRCGSPLHPAYPHCQFCLARAAHPAPPREKAAKGNSVGGAIGLYLALLAVCILAAFVGGEGGEVRVTMGVSIALSAVTLVWCVPAWRGVLPPLSRVPAPGWFAAGAGMALVTFAVATGVIVGLSRVMDLPRETMSDPFLRAGYGWLAVVVVYCVQPAVIEELAFRGVIFSALSKSLSPLETVLVSACMFMILHVSPLRFPHTLALGLGAGYLRLRTRSLYPGILLHFAHNGLCVAAEWGCLLKAIESAPSNAALHYGY